MFSINDTIDTGEPIELTIPTYSEVGHKHEITDVNGLQDIINELKDRIEKLEQKINVKENNDEQ